MGQFSGVNPGQNSDVINIDDSALLPDEKDTAVKALRSWIWEISELGSTTKRQDLDALKAFLSRDVFKFRPVYGRFEISKPALCSFIGTANNSNGLYGDPTGSRRFLTVTLSRIDWGGYTREMNVNQLWAEAMWAYQNGESPDLTPDEAAEAEATNARYRFVDPVEDLFVRHYPGSSPTNLAAWTSSAEILVTLQAGGLGSNAKANAMAIASTLKRLGYTKKRVNDAQGYIGVA